MSEVIDCRQVFFKYAQDYVLRGFDLQVRRGEVIALLGPNGAGKTTSVRVMNGLLPVEKGSICVLGLDPCRAGEKVRARTGVLTETPALYERLTARQNLVFFGTLAGLSRAEVDARSRELLDVFSLSSRAEDRVDAYSKGMKQRLAIARAMLHDPELLFLDEPTSDLDPEAARQVGETILEISGANHRTVVLCTHRLYEAERLCSRVAVMKDGRVTACGTLDELRQAVLPQITIVFRLESAFEKGQLDWLGRFSGISSLQTLRENEVAITMKDEAGIPFIVEHFVTLGARIMAVEPRRASLEEIYLHLQRQESEVSA